MKFLFISDLHLSDKCPAARRDQYDQTALRKFEFVLKTAYKEEAVILQAGDFFNSPRSWHLLADVMELIRKYEVEIYCVYGQHDQYFRSSASDSATNLGILIKSGLVNNLSVSF